MQGAGVSWKGPHSFLMLVEEVKVVEESVEPLSLPSTPERALVAFVDALCFGDLNLAASYIARDACILNPDATLTCNRQEIRAILARLIAMGLQIQAELRSMFQLGDVALCSERWRMRFETNHNGPREQTSRATVVLRFIDDRWKLLLLAPWGFGDTPHTDLS